MPATRWCCHPNRKARELTTGQKNAVVGWIFISGGLVVSKADVVILLGNTPTCPQTDVCSAGGWHHASALRSNPLADSSVDASPSNLACELTRTSDSAVVPRGLPAFGTWLHEFSGVSGGGDDVVLELPPPPSGHVLTLTGLLTLGAWQLARTARDDRWLSRCHGHPVPDWYHGDATQVGRSVPLEFRLASQPIRSICGLLAPHSDPARMLAAQSDGDVDRLGIPHYALFTTAPRGPPMCA